MLAVIAVAYTKEREGCFFGGGKVRNWFVLPTKMYLVVWNGSLVGDLGALLL